MFEHHKAFPNEHTRSLKLILIVVDDLMVGSFLVRIIKSETPYHPILAFHACEALKVIQEMKPDLFLLDYGSLKRDGIDLYEQLHAIEGFEGIPAILSNIKQRFPRSWLQNRSLRGSEHWFELDSFLRSLEEMLA